METMKKINVVGVRLFYGNHMDNKYNLCLQHSFFNISIQMWFILESTAI